MKFSYNWLQTFFQEKLPEPEKLAEIISLRLFEVEEVKKLGNDWIIDIDVLPNRAGDCFSHIGVARELSAILEKKFDIPEAEISGSVPQNKASVSVEVENGKDCPRYSLAIIRGVKVKSSPSWMKEKLESCGLQAINNIVDIANYAMLETGQPMHAFDLAEIRDQKIIVRKAKNNERIMGLDDKEYVLNENILVISDSEKALGIAGIKGGKDAGINENTVDLALEAANFNRIAIRKGSAEIKLRTDASLRFEHGIDPNLIEFGIARAVNLITEIAGGKLTDMIDFYPIKIKTRKINLDMNHAENLLGIEIKNLEAKKTLNNLGFVIKKETGKILEVEIPTQRTDVEFQEDLIEEIGRIHGYEKIEPRLPETMIIPPKENEGLYWGSEVKEKLKNIGFCEAYNYSFISQEQSEIFGYLKKNIIEVEKPVSQEQKYLKPDLTPHLLKNIKENERNFKEIKIFELGKTFTINNGKTEEKEMLGGIMSGDSFYNIKGVVESLLEQLGIKEISFNEFPKAPPYLHVNKRAVIVSKSEEIGFMGDISSRILDALKIKSNVSIFIIDFEKIKKMASREKQYQPFPKFPTVERDLAILVPEKEEFQKVLKTINSLKIDLIENVELFDVYQGKEIPKGKKNIALRLTYRDDEKTLTTDEVNVLHKKVIEKIEKDKNWQVRK